MSRILRPLGLTSLALTGCVQAAYDDAKALSVTEPSSGTSSTSSGGDTGADLPTGPIQTVTGETPPPDPTSPQEQTTGDPAIPPSILEVSFTPDPLTSPGKISIDVATEFATSVTLQLAGAEPAQLKPGLQRHFVGELEIHSGLSNGTYQATFAPFADQLAGAPVIAEYTVALPTAGSEDLWDAPPDFGNGQIEALALTPGGMVVAFGTVFEAGVPRCFLHRRDLAGNYAADDFKVIFPDKTCTATDLVAGDGESLYLLARVVGGDDPRWRLATLTAWGEEPTIVRTGKIGEVAHALARGPGGVVACGAGPTLLKDLDARVWGAGMALEFDYTPELGLDHLFDETITDCAYAGERLVMVGEVYGQHISKGEQEPVNRKRLFVLEDMPGSDLPTWTVAESGPGNMTQSGATALAIDDQGRSIIGLFTCADVCDHFGEVRIYEPGGKLAELVPLANEVLPPFDIAWSPAGYLVLASAEKTDNFASQFLVQAFWPGEFMPVWHYGQAEQPNWHAALALAIGPGVIVAGGFGGLGYPALAYINP